MVVIWWEGRGRTMTVREICDAALSWIILRWSFGSESQRSWYCSLVLLALACVFPPPPGKPPGLLRRRKRRRSFASFSASASGAALKLSTFPSFVPFETHPSLTCTYVILLQFHTVPPSDTRGISRELCPWPLPPLPTTH